MTHRQTQIGTASGFTIVEVVVASVIFAIIAVTIVSITEYVQYSQRQSIYMSIASRAAQSKIAEYQSKGYDNLPTSSVDFSNDNNLDKLPAGHAAQLSVGAATIGSGKQLTATVTYPVGSSTKQVVIKAYVAKEAES